MIRENNAIPIGDIQFYDNYVPALEAGQWHIKVDHKLLQNQQSISGDQLGTSRKFIVTAPQFSLDPSEMVAQYPPNGSAGRYGEILPHIVFKEPMLPWERGMQDNSNRQPWLALLVLGEEELQGGENSATHTLTATVGNFLSLRSVQIKEEKHRLIVPEVIKETDVDDSQACSYIQIPVSVFQALSPRLHELRYLAHCRQINTGDKAMKGINEHGLYAVVVANRFPAAPPDGANPVNNMVHLVSVEGLEKYLVDNPDWEWNGQGPEPLLALITLSSWSFQVLPDHTEDFRGLMQAMISPKMGGRSYQPQDSWLRLPVLELKADDPIRGEVKKRIENGFVPLAYHTRSGEESFAWYRGPLVPLLTTPLKKSQPFLTADAAIIYHSQYGLFDMSLAAAWELGRSLALADRSFNQKLLEFRRQAHILTDQLLYRLQSDCFSQDQIATLTHDTTIQDEFIKMLDQELLQNMTVHLDHHQLVHGTKPLRSDVDPQEALSTLLAQPEVQEKILDLVRTEITDVAQWLARLLLLYTVPFHYIVADERMLPAESLRFFYLDHNWLGALLDGALSIGMDSSRQVLFAQISMDMIQKAAMETAKIYREQLRGVDPMPMPSDEQMMSGILLRSAVVSGWPSLAIRPCLNNGQMLKILRMDRLSSNVLLCIFAGIPDYVEISEPQESLGFGVTDQGYVILRNLIPPVTAQDLSLGKPIDAPHFFIRDVSGQQIFYMRSNSSRVLNINPDDADGGLVPKIKAALENELQIKLTEFGPADFAMQMLKLPEAIQFISITKQKQEEYYGLVDRSNTIGCTDGQYQCY